MNEKLADKMAGYLLENQDERLTYVKVTYFIEMLLSEFEKLIIIFFLFWLCGYAGNILIVFLGIIIDGTGKV